LSNIVSLLPEDVAFIEINHGSASATVTGVNLDEDGEDEIFQYARSLRGKFSSVIISSIEAREDEEGEIEGFEFEVLLE
jgi:uncharacterized protein YrzB (UPF0473 family)